MMMKSWDMANSSTESLDGAAGSPAAAWLSTYARGSGTVLMSIKTRHASIGYETSGKLTHANTARGVADVSQLV
jgi:hypothetical protein